MYNMWGNKKCIHNFDWKILKGRYHPLRSHRLRLENNIKINITELFHEVNWAGST